MSARTSRLRRRARIKKIRCRMCKSTDIRTKEYADEDVKLHICGRCGYPWRSKIPKEEPA